MVKCGQKNADNKKSKRKKTRSADGRKNKETNKQTKERNLSFMSLSHGWTPHLHTYLVHFSFECLV